MSSERPARARTTRGQAAPGGDVPASDDHALLPPTKARPADGAPLRQLVELLPERQVAAAALNRAKEAARARGLRPGDAPRRRTAPAEGTAGPGVRDPLTVGDTLDVIVGQLGGGGAGLVAGTVQHRWPEVMGENASHCEYVGLKAGVLTVRAESTSWATSLTWLVPQILRRIDELVGPGVVSEITVLGPVGPGFGHGRRRVPGRGPRDTYG